MNQTWLYASVFAILSGLAQNTQAQNVSTNKIAVPSGDGPVGGMIQSVIQPGHSGLQTLNLEMLSLSQRSVAVAPTVIIPKKQLLSIPNSLDLANLSVVPTARKSAITLRLTAKDLAGIGSTLESARYQATAEKAPGREIVAHMTQAVNDGRTTEMFVGGSGHASGATIEAGPDGLSPAQAVKIAQLQGKGTAVNRFIKQYFDANKESLTWNDIEILLAGLSKTFFPDDAHDGLNTVRRHIMNSSIDEQGIRKEKLSAELAVRIAQQQDNGNDSNKFIAQYFDANKDSISWGDIETLLAGLSKTLFPDDSHGGHNTVRRHIMHSYVTEQGIKTIPAQQQTRESLEILNAQRRADLANPPAYSPSKHLTQAAYRGFRRAFLTTTDDPRQFKFGSIARLRQEFLKLENDPSLEVVARLLDFARSPVIMPNGQANQVLGDKVRKTPSEKLPAGFRYHRAYVESARSTIKHILGRYSAPERAKIYAAFPGLREELDGI